jgi:ribose transport system ATP-binding protein
VQQHRDLVPTLSGIENIYLGNELRREGRSQRLDFPAMREAARKLAGRFEVDLDLDCPVSRLRVSEQCIVAICKALAAQSKVLLIDEASAPLDNTERQTLYRILQQLRDDGKAIVYISHHLDEVFHIGQRVTVLRNGRVVCTVAVRDIDYDGLIGAMTGSKKLYQRAPKAAAPSAGQRPLLEFRGVAGGHLQEVSFSLHRGEILGFAGLEGSYKDEIARIIYGLSGYSRGQVLLDGKPFRPADPLEAIRSGVGLVPTDRKNAGLVTCRSVAENVVLAVINKAGRMLVAPAWIRRVAKANVRRLGIKTSGVTQLAEYLSGGNQQKVLLSKWLEADVDLLLLVEPTEGIDVGTRAELYEIFRGLAREGKSLLLFTSDIDELLVLCDRIVSLAEGRMVGEYNAEAVDKNRILSDILKKSGGVKADAALR